MRMSSPSPLANTIGKIGRRAASRLRLEMPGKLVTIYETRPCVVANLSRTGAQISLANPAPPGEGCFLQVVEQELFAFVVWRDQGRNGLEFESPLSDEQVLEFRDFMSKIDDMERQALRKKAQTWIQGGIN